MAAPRVSKIELHNAGPFESATLELPPPREGQTGELFLFEGPNGSGKTTIAEAIACAAGAMACAVRVERGEHPLMAPETRFFSRLRSDGRVFVDISADGNIWPVVAAQPQGRFAWPSREGTRAFIDAMQAVSASAHNGLQYSPLTWAAFAYGQSPATPKVKTDGPLQLNLAPLSGALSFGAGVRASDYFGQFLVNLRHELGESALLAMSADASGASDDAVATARLAGDAAKRTLAAIESTLSTLLARAVRFKFGAERKRPNDSHTPEVFFDGELIPFHLLGEGMRRTMSWLTDLLVRLHRIRWADASRSPHEQSFWLILDEVDESLHPRMQMRLVPALRGLFPNANIYMTTHSPFVVASVGEGFVVPLRPDSQHRVSGSLRVEPLHPGQSLEWVIEEVFEAKTGFIDAVSRRALDEHKADIARLRRKEALGAEDWRRLLERRRRLLSYGEEIGSMVAVLEVPVRAAIEAHESAHEGAPEAAE